MWRSTRSSDRSLLISSVARSSARSRSTSAMPIGASSPSVMGEPYRPTADLLAHVGPRRHTGVMVVFAVAVAIAVGVSAALGAYLLLWSVLGAGAVVALLARTPPVRANRLRRRERRRAIERERAARARAERDERRAVRRQVR